ncbi:unnamed protein product [Diatraea saccharalis]|uniref:Uncharacterized protein n=1 Tax=Diatraea saccharalis TaxID=40085 RepID=A0A9N9R1H8_9NEOP|nr:unnamed protein product [Diatraea saccharalis]
MQNHLDQNLETTKNSLPKCKGQKGNGVGFIAFFKLKNMRKKTLLLSANWFCTGLAFYAFSQYLGMIGGNIFLTVALSGIIYVPGGLVCLFVVAKVGRRPTVWIFEIITALCFVFILMTPRDIFANDWPRLVFAGIGFGAIAVSISNN